MDEGDEPGEPNKLHIHAVLKSTFQVQRKENIFLTNVLAPT